MKKVLMLFFCTFILYGCGDGIDENTKIDPPKGSTIPKVSITEAELTGYRVDVKSTIINNGGSGIVEVGYLYNLSGREAPSLENPKSKKKVLYHIGSTEFAESFNLLPRYDYDICFYAKNGVGVAYSEIERVTSPYMDINLLLPGRYKVLTHTSYLNGVYPTYEVKIEEENGEYFIYGLMCTPLGLSSDKTKLKIEYLYSTEGNEFWNYTIRIPYQKSGLNVDFYEQTYPTALVNGSWIMNENSNDLDIEGYLYYYEREKEEVVIELKGGYGLVMCDPITHEIKLDNHFPPVELVLGKNTYPGDSDQYPRPDCKLVRIME